MPPSVIRININLGVDMLNAAAALDNYTLALSTSHWSRYFLVIMLMYWFVTEYCCFCQGMFEQLLKCMPVLSI